HGDRHHRATGRLRNCLKIAHVGFDVVWTAPARKSTSARVVNHHPVILGEVGDQVLIYPGVAPQSVVREEDRGSLTARFPMDLSAVGPFELRHEGDSSKLEL